MGFDVNARRAYFVCVGYILSGILLLLFLQPPRALADVTVSGSFQNPIPIEVPPYHGLEPKLSLVYNSNGGSGFLGVGWSLAGLSTIQRASPGRGAPFFDTPDISRTRQDIALLDGMELVKCMPWTSSPSCQSPSSESARYIYYATKTESYQRIAYDPQMGWWYVWRKDGTKFIYFPSLITIKGLLYNTLRWDLAQAEDRLGNTVAYVTVCDQMAFVPSECYLDSINYNGNIIRLFREDRPDAITYATGGDLMAVMRSRLKTIDVLVGKSRARAYSLHYGVSSSSTRSSLASVQEFGRDANLDSSGTITNANAASKLPSMTFSPAPSNGGVGAWTSTWENAVAGQNWTLDNSPISYIEEQDTGWGLSCMSTSLLGCNRYYYPQCLTGDVNGDGVADLICAEGLPADDKIPYPHVQLYVALNSGSRHSFLPRTTVTSIPLGQMYAADLNGDGLTDLVFVNFVPCGGECNHVIFHGYVGAGDGTFAPLFTDDATDWVAHSDPGILPSGQDIAAENFVWYSGGLQDVNFDGKADIVLATDASHQNPDGTLYYDKVLYVAKSNGRNFEHLPPVQVPGWVNPTIQHHQIYLAGDFNGDGRTDFAIVVQQGAHDTYTTPHPMFWVALSTDAGVAPLPPQEYGTVRWVEPDCAAQWYAVDVNGDGKTDIVLATFKYVNGDYRNAIQVFLSRGDGTFDVVPEQVIDSEFLACGQPFLLLQITATFSIGPGVGLSASYQHILSGNPLPRPSLSGPDLNGDGYGDFLLIQYSDDNRVELSELSSNGDGTFKVGRSIKTSWSVDPSSTPPFFLAADVDGGGTDGLFFFKPGTPPTLFTHSTSATMAVAYFPNTGRDTFHWHPADVNGNGRTDQVYVQQWQHGVRVYTAVNGGWNASKNSQDMPLAAGAPADTSAKLGSLVAPDARKWKVMDVDGDGRSDLVYLESYYDATMTPPYGLRVYTLFSNGNGLYTATYQNALPGYRGVDTQNWIPADVDGDGKFDLVHIVGYNVPADEGIQVETLQSVGDGTWAFSSQVVSRLGGIPGLDQPEYSHWKVADVNGDGKADLVYVKRAPDGGVIVYTLLSISSSERGLVGWVGQVSPVQFQRDDFPDTFNWKLLDINGDGKADLVYVRITPYTGPCTSATACDSNVHIRVLFSTGNGSTWLPQPFDWNAGQPIPLDGFNWRQVDVNGDGKTDLVYASPGGVYTILARDTGGWSPVLFNPQTFAGSIPQIRGWQPAGVDDNGQPVLAIPQYDSSNNFGVQQFSSTATLDTLTSFSNGMGATTTVSYLPSFKRLLSVRGSPCHVPAGMIVMTVSSVAMADGRSTASTLNYEYECPRWSHEEQAFLGWGHVRSTDPGAVNVAPSVTDDFNAITDHCWVQPSATKVTDPASSVFTSTQFSYLAEGRTAPYVCLPESRQTVECNLTTQCRWIQTEFHYDEFGNIITTDEHGVMNATGDERSTVTGYNPNRDAFIVGLPSSVEVREGILPEPQTVKSRFEYCYDGDVPSFSSGGIVTIGPPRCWKPPAQGLVTLVRHMDDQHVVNDRGHTYPAFVETVPGYDPYGNVTSIKDAKSRITTIEYDDIYHFYPTKILNPLRQPIILGWDYPIGEVLVSTDANNITTSMKYDPLALIIRDFAGEKRKGALKD